MEKRQKEYVEVCVYGGRETHYTEDNTNIANVCVKEREKRKCAYGKERENKMEREGAEIREK